MNEASAREVVLARAIETHADRALWPDEDRQWATRAAAEVVGESAPPERFLARRAALVLERLSPGHPALGRALRAVSWRGWIGSVLALLALVLGLASNQLGGARRVNILAFPLLGLLAWNLFVYAALLLHLPLGRRPGGPLRRFVARLAQGVQGVQGVQGASGGEGEALGPALAAFFADWSRRSLPLLGARAARVLHGAAALFALGAVGGMYVRGLVFEFRAGWESTFLTAENVRALLAFALAPGSLLTGIAVPDAAQLERLRFGAGTGGDNAAPWIHLYAASTVAIVLAPRVLLALFAWLRERRWTARFPLSLDEPYFARLRRGYARSAARVRVVPYSYQAPVASVQGLAAVVARSLGPHAQVEFAEPVAYGAEEEQREVAGADLVVALFHLTATPERENQAAFLAALRGRVGAAAALIAVVDESGFRRRFSGQPERIEERRAAWRQAIAGLDVESLFVDLSDPDRAGAEAALEGALDRAAARGAR